MRQAVLSFMAIEDRMKLIPYEAIVGLSLPIVATILYLIGLNKKITLV